MCTLVHVTLMVSRYRMPELATIATEMGQTHPIRRPEEEEPSCLATAFVQLAIGHEQVRHFLLAVLLQELHEHVLRGAASLKKIDSLQRLCGPIHLLIPHLLHLPGDEEIGRGRRQRAGIADEPTDPKPVSW